MRQARGILEQTLAALAVLSSFLGEGVAAGQAAPPVPAEYQDLYASTEQKLNAFDAKLTAAWDGSRYPVAWASELLSANGNRGRALLAPTTMPSVRRELDRLKALGVQAVVVALPYPVIHPPFLAWNGDPEDFQPLVSFFAQVSSEVHARGMKLAIETAVMFGGSYSAGSGMNAAGYYPTVSDAEFVAGRAAVVRTIASQVQPDFIQVGAEPDTEATLTGKAFLGSPSSFAGMVQSILSELSAAGLLGIPVLAGSGTWKGNASSFVAELVKLPGLWGIDLHLYPLNRDYLDQALSLAAQAHAAGKRVTMMECWPEKERDSELGTMNAATDTTIFARDAFSFWAPLDQKFLSLLVKYGNAARLDLVSPFWSRHFFAYLDHDTVMAAAPPPTPDQIIAMATAAHSQALFSGRISSTGRAWSSFISGPPGTSTVTKVVPIVLDTEGVGGARYTTELTLANRGTTRASVQLAYTPATALSASGGGTVSLTLEAGRQIVLADALAHLRSQGLPIPTGSNQGGALRVTFTGLSAPDVAFAGGRTTTPSGTGRAGLATPGVSSLDAQTGPSFVYGLRSTAEDRTNLALVNAASSGSVTLRVTLYSADGRRAALPEVSLAAGQWTQLPRVLDAAGYSSAFALIEMTAGYGPYVAYGVFNDNATNDGSFVPFEGAALPAETRLVPVLVESAAYRSELVLANPTSAPLTATLTYVESSAPSLGAGGTTAFSLRPAEQRILPDAIDVLRNKGIAIGPRGAGTYAGTLAVAFASASGPAAGFAGARTAAPAGGTGPGGYGLFYAGVGPTSAAEGETWVYGLQQNGTSRSNLALASLGDGDDAVTLRVDVFDGETGTLAGSAPPVTLAVRGWIQLNAVLDGFGVSNGYARIARLSGMSRFAAYGVVNDGAAPGSGATNDGSFVAMSNY